MRQRLTVLAILGAVGGCIVVIVTGIGGGAATSVQRSHHAAHGAAGAPRPAAFAVGLRVLRLVDRARSEQLPNGLAAPRTLVTYVRYPAIGAVGTGDRANAPAATADGPFPLVVFGHGFAVTPGLYASLLRDWARAGYVVVAPVFPLANANAPGGPNESDLPNQPADMRFVISRMLAAGVSAAGPFGGLIDRRRIAVAGQSDGGDTALATAYDPRFRDVRIGAAIILSGSEIPGMGGFQIPSGGPPLLAVQGTADTINPPEATDAFYTSAPAPKYLLELTGAGHLQPYATEQPQLSIVARVSIEFLNHYLGQQPGSLKQLVAAGRMRGVATLDAHP